MGLQHNTLVFRQSFVGIAGAVSLALLLGACDGSSSSPAAPPASSALTGYYVDSTVTGLDYKTPTHSGKTAADGSFQYEDGETVTFSVGGLEIGSIQAAEKISPLDSVPVLLQGNLQKQLFDKPEARQRLYAILSILQTLDVDQDASNGITIPDNLGNLLAGIDLTEDGFNYTTFKT